MKEKFLYLGVLVPILVISLLLQIYKIEPFESFSLTFNDINFNLQKKEPSESVVFVAVDEPSVNKFGRWPWKREIIAKGIEGLVEADVVLMDMIFSEPTTDKQDTILTDALSDLKSSVCGFFLRKNSTQNISDEELEILEDSSLDLLQSQISEFKSPEFISAPFAEMNILPILEACSLSGSFTTITESDHLFRSYPIAVYFQNILYPSLAIQGLRLKFNKDIERVDASHIEINGHIVGVNKNGFTRLNFYKLEHYKIVSFLDIVIGKIKPNYFKNKIVILGITEVGAGDVVSTPMGSIPGPLLHYTFISNLLENHLIKEPKNIVLLLIVFMVLLPFSLLLVLKKILYRAIINIIVYILIYIYIRVLNVFKRYY